MKFLQRELNRISGGSTFKEVSKKDIRSLGFALPPHSEQKKIAEILSSVDDAFEKTSQIIETTKDLKKGLIQKLFTEGIGQTGFKKTKIGRIPEEWGVKKIADLLNEGTITEIQDGNHGNANPKSSDYVPSGIPFIMANNLVNGSVDLENCKFIRKEQADNFRIGFSKPNDVLLSHKGTIGKVAIVPNVPDYIMLTPQVTYYRIGTPGQLLSIFLRYFFESENFQTTLLRLSEQSTRKYVGITEQKKMSMLLPPITEQYRIASILVEVDSDIEKEANHLEQQKLLKKGLMQVLFTGKLRVSH